MADPPTLLTLLPLLRLPARLLARLAPLNRAFRHAVLHALRLCVNLHDEAAGGAALRALASVHPRALVLEFARNLTDADVLPLLQPPLEELNLNAAQHVGDAAVTAAAARCPALTTVSLYWNVRLTDSAVAALAAGRCAPRLSSLNLSGCRHLTDASPLSAFPALTALDLTRCASLTDATLHKLAAAPGLRLEALVLYADSQFSARAMRAVLLTHLPSLTRLDLCGCNNLTDGAVLAALGNDGAPLRLKTLNLTYAVELSDLSLRPLLRRCRALEWLSLHGLPRVTAASLKALNAPQLRALDVNGCGSIPLPQRRPAALLQIVPSLRVFTLHG